MEIQRGDFMISTDRQKLPVEAIHRFLSVEAYWCKHISFETVKKATAHSLNFCVYHQGDLAGYARVISDYSTIAYLGDVFILPLFRGQGLSKWLIETIMTHPDLQGLRRWILLTRDAHRLYEQYGWKTIADPARWMEVHQPNAYLPNN